MLASRFMPFRAALSPTVNEERPSPLLMWLEARATMEMASLPLALPALLRYVPRGDGHPVLVLPGLLADDASTAPLRQFLSGRGYAVQGWGQGRNLGPREGVVAQMREMLAQMHASEQRKVSIIGWSLGGVFARELARHAPESVRQVITLGSPRYDDLETNSNAEEVHKLGSGRTRGDDGVRGDGAPPVPTTSIYTRMDGVVGWGCSVERQSATTDNIEINSATHTGLGVNPLVWYALGDRLAQPEDQWAQFAPKGFAKLLFPFTAPQR
ncbi:alpha/beta hydrolase [soil metagenome]